MSETKKNWRLHACKVEDCCNDIRNALGLHHDAEIIAKGNNKAHDNIYKFCRQHGVSQVIVEAILLKRY